MAHKAIIDKKSCLEMNIPMNEKAMAGPVADHLSGADVAIVVAYFLERQITELPEDFLETVLKSCVTDFEIQAAT